MFVVDASVVTSWAFLGENTELSAKIRRRMLAGQMAVVPAIFPFEIANVLLLAERAGRIGAETAEQFLLSLNKLRISIEVTESARLYYPIRQLAAKHQLSIYDASYVELAMRDAIPLATFDNRLRKAASSLGVSLLD